MYIFVSMRPHINIIGRTSSLQMDLPNFLNPLTIVYEFYSRLNTFTIIVCRIGCRSKKTFDFIFFYNKNLFKLYDKITVGLDSKYCFFM